MRRHNRFLDLDETPGPVVGSGLQQDVNGGKTCLLTIWCEYNNRLLWCICLDGLIHRTIHRQQSRSTIRNVETLDDDLERYSTNVRMEIEQTTRWGTDPFRDILGVGKGGSQTDNTDRSLKLDGDITHT